MGVIDLHAGQINLHVQRMEPAMGRIDRVAGRVHLDVRPINIVVGRTDLAVGGKISLRCEEDCLWGGLIG